MPSRNNALAAALLLAGCGGGYGSAPPADMPPPPVPGSQYRPDEPPLPAQPGDDQPLPSQAPQRLPAEPPADLPQDGGPRGTSDGVRYDAVGYATSYGAEMGRDARTASGDRFDPDAITAAHRTLPLGSYAEVTSLDTGRTILVLIDDRGPSAPNRVIDLSHGAARLLGVDGVSIPAVRVRSAVASPQDATALHSGRPAGPRVDAPQGLLVALRRQLPVHGGEATASTASAAPMRHAANPPGATDALPALPPTSLPKPSPIPSPGYYVQVAALSNADRARALAAGIGGRVSQAGAIYRVQTGPFRDAKSAERARDDLARRGYGDARIVQP